MNKENLLKALVKFEGHVLIDNNFTFFKVGQVIAEADRYEDIIKTVPKYKWFPFITEKRLVRTFIFGTVTIIYQRNININSEGKEFINCESIKEMIEWCKALSDGWTRLQNIKSDLITFNVNI